MGSVLCGPQFGGRSSMQQSEEDFQAVRQFWEQIKPHKKELGEETYKLLFKSHPEYKELFAETKVDHMSMVFMTMLERTIEAKNLDKMMLKLCAVAKIHAMKNVPKESFTHFLEALLNAIENVFCEETNMVDPEDLACFVEFFDKIASTIKENMGVHDILTYPAKNDDTGEDDFMPLSEALEIFQIVWQEKVEKEPKVKQRIGSRLYEVFFNSHPEYEYLFHGDINHQANVLMRMFGMFSAQGLEKFASQYDVLIERHSKMGLTRKHFAHFGQALIVTLKIELGDDFTADEVKAFRQVYSLLAMPMQVALEKQYIDSTSKTPVEWVRKKSGYRAKNKVFQKHKLSAVRGSVSGSSKKPNSRASF